MVIIVNDLPVARAGADRSVFSGVPVTLNAAASSDTEGAIAAYQWQQTAGPEATLSSATASITTFTAPAVTQETTLTFRLVVTDSFNVASEPDDVAITILPSIGPTVRLTGVVRYERVPFSPTRGAGLDYANQALEPSRGARLEVVTADSQIPIAVATTGADGSYSLDVPANVQIAVRMFASMVKEDALPRWRFNVQDVEASIEPHSFTGPSFTATATAIHDVTIPSGWSPSGELIGARAAAPFAILDTLYRAYTAILAVNPQADFRPLDVDWATSNPGGTAFYRSGSVGTIMLSGEADVDTDEYDPALIAHEFGHYVEDVFWRSDTIGGSHDLGDSLDPRNAFSEGFATAFGSMVLNDPLYRDSFGAGQARNGEINVEHALVNNRGWYNELSVAVLLWDLFDQSNEAGDSVTLNFQQLWDALVTQRTTPALVSIFPFITELKQQQPAAVAGIRQLATAHLTRADFIDAYGSAETNNNGSPDVLPIYTPITLGGPAVTVRSTNEFRRDTNPTKPSNKLSVHRFLRLQVDSPQTVRLRVVSETAGKNANTLVYLEGASIGGGGRIGDEDSRVVLPAAGTYIIDVYDCDNSGCGSVERTPEPASISVSVTAN